MPYGLEFENYLIEARGTVEYDGFESSDNDVCDSCNKQDCVNCKRLKVYSDYCPWFNDNGSVIEYKSNKYAKFETLLKFTNNIVRKYKDSENLILHSLPGLGNLYGEEGINVNDCCGLHIHVSPRSYNLYKLLTQQLAIFQPLYKNSPSIEDEGNVLSLRHLRSPYGTLDKVRSKNVFIGTNLPRSGVFNNQIGTIEVRFSDFPKSLNQIALTYYLERISKNLMSKKATEFFKDVALDNNFKRVHTMKDLVKPINRNPNNFESYIKGRFNKSFEKQMLDWSEKIEQYFPSMRFYSFYQKRMLPFSDFIKNSWDYEKKIFETFFKEKWDSETWSDYWKSRFLTEVPTNIFKQ